MHKVNLLFALEHSVDGVFYNREVALMVFVVSDGKVRKLDAVM